MPAPEESHDLTTIGNVDWKKDVNRRSRLETRVQGRAGKLACARVTEEDKVAEIFDNALQDCDGKNNSRVEGEATIHKQLKQARLHEVIHCYHLQATCAW